MKETEERNDLTVTLDRIQKMLVRGAADRRSAFRWPVLSTVSKGEARGRIIVLRKFDPEAWQFYCYTDHRSEKVDQIEASPSVQLTFFDPRAMIQIRIAGDATIDTSSEWRAEVIKSLPDHSLTDYSSGGAPGTELSTGESEPSFSREQAEANFSIVSVRCASIDYLSLDREGHRRATFVRSDLAEGTVAFSGSWVVP
ncbi:MAG: pyridoxamine 5'-phosphate oxidase family protein [Pseudomonadota bacterium]